MVGGGHWPRAGEISLAHRGVLFLDELSEFGSRTLEGLRQPLEDHEVTIARSTGTLTFPANFQLIATINPRPCGYHGDPKREGTCSVWPVSHCEEDSSGAPASAVPLLDRMDIHPRAAEGGRRLSESGSKLTDDRLGEPSAPFSGSGAAVQRWNGSGGGEEGMPVGPGDSV